MSTLKVSEYGNTASEQGAYESGVDPEGINESEMPYSRPQPLEVRATIVEGQGLVLEPEYTAEEDQHFRQAIGELQEGPMALMSAQLLEEPEPPVSTGLAVRKINGVEVIGNEGRLAEVGKRSPRESLIWYGQHPEYNGAVLGDRILVLKDTLEQENACRECGGKGYDEEAICGLCKGTQVEVSTGGEASSCRSCMCLGYGKTRPWSSGRGKCGGCRGTGWRKGIILPEESQTKAITGLVVSVGPLCQLLKLGDRILHSAFAGHDLKVSDTKTFTIMRESEVLEILAQKKGFQG